MSFYYSNLTNQAFVNEANKEHADADFCIWAEENAGLGNNEFEWAYGNGDNTENDFGIVLFKNAELIGMSTDATGSAVIEVRKNGSSAGVSINRANGRTVEFVTPVPYQAGDRFNFRTLSNSGGSGSGTRVVAWFRFT